MSDLARGRAPSSADDTYASEGARARTRVGSLLELLFFLQLQDAQLAEGCEREFIFAPPRRWRFDFAWPLPQIAIEVEGGSWIQGSHNRGARFEQDSEKYNEAVVRGWRVFRFTTDQVNDGRAIAFTRRIFARFTGRASVASG
jgi:very-short-patch-repair endonuclease